MQTEKVPFAKSLVKALVLLAIALVFFALGKKFGFGINLCILGLLCWAKCFELKMDPASILKLWTGALTGVLLVLAFAVVGAKFGELPGIITFIVLLLINIALDMGEYCPWVCNAATQMFLAATLMLINFETPKEVLTEYAAGLILGGGLPLIAALIVRSRAGKANQEK